MLRQVCWLNVMVMVVVWAAEFHQPSPPASPSLPQEPDWDNPRFIYDEREDEPVTLDVVCTRFLAPQVDDAHIVALLSEMPLELPENLRELTEDPACKPLAVNRCHLFNGKQLVRVIEELGGEGVRAYGQSGCLRRMGKLDALQVQHVKVLAAEQVFELEQWHTLQPASLLALMEAANWSRSLPTLPDNLTRLQTYFSDQQWRRHPHAWELFAEDRLLEAVAKSHLVPLQEALLGLLDPETIIAAQASSALALRLSTWGRLAVVHQALLLGLLTHLPPNKADAVAVIGQLVAQMGKGAAMKLGLNGGQANRALRSRLAPLWQVPVWALGQALTPEAPSSSSSSSSSASTSSSKQVQMLRRVVASLPPTLKENLHRHFRDSSLAGDQLWAVVRNDALGGEQAPPRTVEWSTMLLKMNLRPVLSDPEMAFFQSLIAQDIAQLQENVSRRNPLEGNGTQVSDIPTTLVKWLATASFFGNEAMFAFLAEQLPGITGDFGITEDALVRLAETMPDLREAAISLLRRPDRLVQLLVRKLRNESGRENIQFDQNVPLELLQSKHGQAEEDEETKNRVALFLNKSFDFCLRKGASLVNKSFTVKYKDQEGLDGGGLRRNWIFRMLTAMMDPVRSFFHSQPGTVGLFMAMAVDPQMFLAFGRLTGRAFYDSVGMPQPLHPQLLELLRLRAQEATGQLDRSTFISKAHGQFAEIHQDFLRGIRCYQRDTPNDVINEEEFNSLCLAKPKYLRLTNARRVSNFFKPVEKETHQMQTTEWPQVVEYAKHLETRLKDAWVTGVDQLFSGLNEFLHADLFASIDPTLLADLFSPKEGISDEAWLAAFKLSAGDRHTVKVSPADDIDPALLEDAPFGNDNDDDEVKVLPMEVAFKQALLRLTNKERLGLIGQLSGAIQVGPAGYRPEMFKVAFRPARSTRRLGQLQEDVSKPQPEKPDTRQVLTAENLALQSNSSGDGSTAMDIAFSPDRSSEVEAYRAIPRAQSPQSQDDDSSADSDENNRETDYPEEEEEEEEEENENEEEGEVVGRVNRSEDDDASQDLFAEPSVAPLKLERIDLPTAQSWYQIAFE